MQPNELPHANETPTAGQTTKGPDIQMPPPGDEMCSTCCLDT